MGRSGCAALRLPGPIGDAARGAARGRAAGKCPDPSQRTGRAGADEDGARHRRSAPTCSSGRSTCPSRCGSSRSTATRRSCAGGPTSRRPGRSANSSSPANRASAPACGGSRPSPARRRPSWSAPGSRRCARRRCCSASARRTFRSGSRHCWRACGMPRRRRRRHARQERVWMPPRHSTERRMAGSAKVVVQSYPEADANALRGLADDLRGMTGRFVLVVRRRRGRQAVDPGCGQPRPGRRKASMPARSFGGGADHRRRWRRSGGPGAGRRARCVAAGRGHARGGSAGARGAQADRDGLNTPSVTVMQQLRGRVADLVRNVGRSGRAPAIAALDIGTEFAKALVVSVEQDPEGRLLGVVHGSGRQRQGLRTCSRARSATSTPWWPTAVSRWTRRSTWRGAGRSRR